MDAVLLAGGYGTRLYPLTRDRPKSLLPVGGRPITDYLVEALGREPSIRRMWVVTNDRFAGHFKRWADDREFPGPLTVLNDGTTSNEDRLGAVGDVGLVLDAMGRIPGDGIYVAATDNIPRFDMTDIISLSAEKGTSAVFACPEGDRERLKRAGVARLDEEGRIVEFEEKPDSPAGDLRVPPFYCFTADVASLVGAYLDGGNDPDAPGNFLAWLVTRRPVYARVSEEGTCDIGTLESYRQVCREFEPR